MLIISKHRLKDENSLMIREGEREIEARLYCLILVHNRYLFYLQRSKAEKFILHFFFLHLNVFIHLVDLMKRYRPLAH